jgi:hypothetical protein
MTTGNRLNEFGKRAPAPLPPAPGPKRSHHVALLVMGTLAVGGGAYALMPRQNCDPVSPGMAAPATPQTTACAPRSSSSSGGSGGYSRSSYWSFFGSGSSGGSSSSISTSSGVSESSHVSRGGFGSFGRAFGGGSGE